jgi:hypothetical protein
MKIRYQSINEPKLGDYLQTRWGEDQVHLKVTNIVSSELIHGDLHSYECEGELACVDIDWSLH